MVTHSLVPQHVFPISGMPWVQVQCPANAGGVFAESNQLFPVESCKAGNRLRTRLQLAENLACKVWLLEVVFEKNGFLYDQVVSNSVNLWSGT